MIKRSEMLFWAIRCALWGTTFQGELSEEEFVQTLRTAKEQTVYGLVFDALSQLKGEFDKRIVFDGVVVSETIRKQNMRVNKEQKEIVLMLEKEGVNFLIVKGQTYSALYPKPELRMSGDIDFLIHQHYYSVRNIIEQRISLKLPLKMVEREVAFEHGGVSFELHTSLRDWARKRHQEIWDNLMKQEWQEVFYVEIDGVKVRTLSPTINAAYVFIHLFFHFIREGVALRQFCDWAMVLHHYRKEIDRQRLCDILDRLDMTNAYKAFGVVLFDELGLPKEDFPFELSDNDRRWKEKILRDIFDGGNFGKKNHKARNEWLFKLETMGLALRNSLRYYSLCPSEVGGMIPRLVKANLRLLI